MMRTQRFISLFGVLFILCVLPENSFAAVSVYLAQTAQGANDGSSCVNARAAAWFNSPANWGHGAQQIGSGTTVFLCGTISTSLTFQGTGSSGSPITVDGTGASFSGEFNTNNRSWWKVQNVTFTGGGGMITIVGGTNGVFTKNHGDNLTGAVFLAQAGGTVRPDQMTISHNYMRTTTADLGLSGQLDLIVTEGSTNVVIEGNYLEMRAGGKGGGSQHDDCIQTWQKGGANGGPPGNWTVRYNKIVMNSPSPNDRSWMMLENLTGTINIYGNVFLGLQGAGAANGIAGSGNGSGVVFNFFNNTVVAKNGASNNIFNMSSPGTLNLKNNIFHTENQTNLTGNMPVVRDHNLWFGSNIPSCSGRVTELCGKDPRFTSYAGNDFSLTSNSPALNAGVDLGSSYDLFILPGATWPNPALGERAAGSSWSLSAYDQSTVVVEDETPPSLPSGLKATSVSTKQINLNWTAATDNVAVTGYNIYRGGVRIGTSASVSYAAQGLMPATSYSFQIEAFDAAGLKSALTASVTLMTLASDTQPAVLALGLPSGTLAAGAKTAVLSLTTNEKAVCHYATAAGVAYASMPGTFVASPSGLSHTAPVSDLGEGSYSYYVRCEDVAKNVNASDYLISFKVAKPNDPNLAPPTNLKIKSQKIK